MVIRLHGYVDPQRGNVNDCAVDGVLRRHRFALLASVAELSSYLFCRVEPIDLLRTRV